MRRRFVFVGCLVATAIACAASTEAAAPVGEAAGATDDARAATARDGWAALDVADPEAAFGDAGGGSPDTASLEVSNGELGADAETPGVDDIGLADLHEGSSPEVFETADDIVVADLPEVSPNEVSQQPLDTADASPPAPPEEVVEPLDADPAGLEDAVTPDAATDCVGPTCLGAPWPEWKLVDLNPGSPDYALTYGREKFSGKATLVVLLESG